MTVAAQIKGFEVGSEAKRCINALYKCVDRQCTLSLVPASPVP